MDILDINNIWTPFTTGEGPPPKAIGAEMALDNSRPQFQLRPAKVHYATPKATTHYRVDEGR